MFPFLLEGQYSEEYRASGLKTEMYKYIIQSDDFKDKNKCHIIAIKTNAMNEREDYLEFFPNFEELLRYNKIRRRDGYQIIKAPIPIYDIIKIFEPFDKWASIYKENPTNKSIEIVIPVRYDYQGDEYFPEEMKYFLFRMNISYNEKNELIITYKATSN